MGLIASITHVIDQHKQVIPSTAFFHNVIICAFITFKLYKLMQRHYLPISTD